ncbi:MAG: DUF1385 domain-containing protein [Lachnospiraceae bacterium]
MKNSGIGGQAVIEGVMMKNKEKYAVSVRLSDGSIVTDVKEYKSITEKHKWMSLPFIRGSVNLIESMIVGMRTLTYSADFFEDEDEKPASKDADGKNKDGDKEGGFMTGGVLFGTVAAALLLAIGLFMLLPQLVAEGISSLLDFEVGGKFCAFIEGLMRLVIFIGYVLLISLMNDIKRTFMYHGAEHKSINCLEHGMELTVENVRKSSKEHKRCGTSFMIIVMVIAIIIFMIIPPITAFGPIVNFLLRFCIRIVMLPVIAGVSYEFLKLAGRSNNPVVNILSKPGMWMQALTTKEPNDDMIEVAIASVEAVFDWRSFLKENFDRPEE